MDDIFQIESHEEFQKVLQEVLYNYYSTSNGAQTSKTSNIIKLAKDDLKKLLIQSNFDTNKIPELFIDKGWDAAKVSIFVNLLEEKKTELLYASLIKQNSEYGETIMNFDWSLKLVLGTSEFNALKYPLLQLILFTDNNSIQKKLMYDINKDMLLKTIDALETLHSN